MKLWYKHVFLLLILAITAQGQRLSPPRGQCRSELAQWGGQSGLPSDATALSLKELDRRIGELLACIPGDYDNINAYSRLKRSYEDQKCVRMDLFPSHHNLIPQFYAEDEQGICCRKFINRNPTQGKSDNAAEPSQPK
jgi:hypothetical protein